MNRLELVVAFLGVLVWTGCEDQGPRVAEAPLASEGQGVEESRSSGGPAVAGTDLARTMPESLLGAERHEGTLRFDPADLSTATFEEQPSVAFPRREMSESEVAEIASRFELVTWPERAVVPTTPRYLDDAVENGGYSRIVFAPDAPLQDRWYAIRGRLVDGEEALPDVAPRDREYVVSRFHVGSLLIVRRVTAYDSTDGMAVQVRYSERVRATSNPFRVRVLPTREGACRVVNDAELASSDGATSILLHCSERGAAAMRLEAVAAVGSALHDEPARVPGAVSDADVIAGSRAIVVERMPSEPMPIGRAAPAGPATIYVPTFGLSDEI